VSDWYCEEVLSGRAAIHVVAETDGVLAFHHTDPSYDGAHIVVIPKLHVASILSDELAETLLLELLGVVRAVASDVLDKTGACRIVTNLGDYQESKHLHWHVVSGERRT
jgi:histidine triad (HIT) family protein